MEVRQGVQCAGKSLQAWQPFCTDDRPGDLTLDAGMGHKLRSGSMAYFYNGLHSTHQCRNWDTINSFLSENRDFDRNGSILDT